MQRLPINDTSLCPPQDNRQPKAHTTKILLDFPISQQIQRLRLEMQDLAWQMHPPPLMHLSSFSFASFEVKKNNTKKLNYGVALETLLVRNHARGGWVWLRTEDTRETKENPNSAFSSFPSHRKLSCKRNSNEIGAIPRCHEKRSRND